MKSLIRQTLCAMLCIAVIGNTACTSMVTLEATPESVASHNIEPGDKVTLLFKDHDQIEIKVTAIDESGITGTDSDGLTIVADFEQLAAVKRVEFDGRETARNTGKGVGVVLIGAAVLVAMTAGAMSGLPYD